MSEANEVVAVTEDNDISSKIKNEIINDFTLVQSNTTIDTPLAESSETDEIISSNTVENVLHEKVEENTKAIPEIISEPTIEQRIEREQQRVAKAKQIIQKQNESQGWLDDYLINSTNRK